MTPVSVFLSVLFFTLPNRRDAKRIPPLLRSLPIKGVLGQAMAE